MNAGLFGCRALVTGGSSGIGFAISEALAAEGVDLAIASRNPSLEAVERLRNKTRSAVAIQVDVRNEDEVVRMVRTAEEALGGLDLFINCAAAAHHQPITQWSMDAWRSTIDTNVTASVVACREVSRRFIHQGRGSILIVGSTTLSAALPQETSYRASKAALKAHMEVLAVELAPFGIRVNMLTPGAFDTPFVASADPAQRQFVVRQVPLRREGQPAELGPTAVLLLSDRLSPYTTGADVCVDGGLSLRPIFGGDDNALRGLNEPS
jgi:NAD(P)-dependent dehydrogenase (short-subunit alcohol dehydrogenase family)